MANPLASTRCDPIATRGDFALVLKVDLEALKAENLGLRVRLREIVHENATMACELDRLKAARRVPYEENDMIYLTD